MSATDCGTDNVVYGKCDEDAPTELLGACYGIVGVLDFGSLLVFLTNLRNGYGIVMERSVITPFTTRRAAVRTAPKRQRKVLRTLLQQYRGRVPFL